MKRALVRMTFELFSQMLCLPAGTKILRGTNEPEYPNDITLLLEGDSLPDSCAIQGGPVMRLNPTYKGNWFPTFQDWGDK
jgi:hypothetical protein